VPSEREGELELGSDAVGPGDQHRLPKALGQLDQGAEAADTRQDLGAQRPSGVGLDVLDQTVAGVDVDASLEVRRGAAWRWHGKDRIESPRRAR